MFLIDKARDLRDAVPGLEIRTNESMSAHTSFCVGGPVDIWCRPTSADQLVKAIKYASGSRIDRYIVGKGSNLIVCDGGIRGLVIETTGLDGLNIIDENVIEAECGISLANLAAYARDMGLSGLEFAHGIPGTLGGAVFMNAGAYGGEMRQCVTETDYFTPDGDLLTLRGEEHLFGYRTSFFVGKPDYVILRTRIRLTPGDRDEITAQMAELRRRRQESQPLRYPSAGSFFKRPPGYFAGKLISDCGLKGCAVGGAQVSEKHAGFIINTGEATCRDVLALMERVKKDVKKCFGVDLEPEVRIIGEDKKL